MNQKENGEKECAAQEKSTRIEKAVSVCTLRIPTRQTGVPAGPLGET